MDMTTTADIADVPAGTAIKCGVLDEREVAALVVALRCRAARAAQPGICVAPRPGALPHRWAWQGPAPYDTMWSQHVH